MDPRAKAGFLLIALGSALFALMLAFPERLHVPPWVGHLAAATLGLAGALSLANAHARRATRAWLAVAVLACMFAPAAWIAFGPGARSCAFGFGPWSGYAGVGCRVAFGIGAAMVLAMVAMALKRALARGADEA